MKKKLTILCVAIAALLAFSACSADDSSSSQPKETTAATTEAVETTVEDITTTATDTTVKKDANTSSLDSCEKIVNYLSDSLGGNGIIQMRSDLIGAQDGYAFMLDNLTYEVYRFDDASKIEDAKDGEFTFTMEMFGAHTMKSMANGSYMMLTIETPADKVADAFMALDLA